MKSDLISMPFTRIILTLLFLISCAGIEMMGQRYQTRTYTEADGLANSMIFDMEQDSSGVLWIGRRSGISSYDGTSFINYNVADGLLSTSYRFLIIDEKEHLWALPESGALFVSSLEGTKWQTISTNRGIPNPFSPSYSSFDVFYYQGEPVILVGTLDKGFLIYQHKRWKLFTVAAGLPDNRINSARSFGGVIYIATDMGLVMLQNDIVKPVHDSCSPLLSGNILAMERQGNLLWLLGENWLGYLTEGKFKMIIKGFQLPVKGIGRQCFLHAGRDRKIYFGNSFKVFSYSMSANQLHILDRNNGLISEGGTAVLVDRELNTWITGYRGITKIPSERFASYYEKDGLSSNEVAAAIEISPGMYVFGHDGALTFFDGKNMTRFILDPVRLIANYETRVLDIQKDL